MKTTFNLAMLCVFLFMLNPVSAVPTGMTIEYSNNPLGPVTFSGEGHASQKLICADCHPKIFPQKKGATRIAFADHTAGKAFCFACHNGKPAFKAVGNCARCHLPAN